MRRAHAAAVDVGEVEREARVPARAPLRARAGEVGHVLDGVQKQVGHDQRAVGARQAARRDVVPARVLEVAARRAGSPAVSSVRPMCRRHVGQQSLGGRHVLPGGGPVRDGHEQRRAALACRPRPRSGAPSPSTSSVSARSKPARPRGPVPIEAQKQVPPACAHCTATTNAAARRCAVAPGPGAGRRASTGRGRRARRDRTRARRGARSASAAARRRERDGPVLAARVPQVHDGRVEQPLPRQRPVRHAEHVRPPRLAQAVTPGLLLVHPADRQGGCRRELVEHERAVDDRGAVDGVAVHAQRRQQELRSRASIRTGCAQSAGNRTSGLLGRGRPHACTGHARAVNRK